MINYLRIRIAGQKAKMDERGASAVEYGLLIAGIAAVIVIAVFALGPVIRDAFDDTCDIVEGKGTTAEGNCADGTTTTP